MDQTPARSSRRARHAFSKVRGNLALGTGPVSLVLAAIAAFVYHLARTGKDTPADQLNEREPRPRRHPVDPFPAPREAPEEA